MRVKYIYLYIVIFALFSPFLEAKEPLTLNRCVEIALKNHPGIKAYQERFRAAQARVSQAKAIPQPEVGLDFDLQPRAFNFKGSREQYIGITQLIEFPGKRSLRGKVAQKDSEASLCELGEFKLELVYRVKVSFYRLLHARERQKHAAENLAYALEFQEKAIEKYDLGDVSKLEVLRAGVEVSRAKNHKTTLESAVKSAMAELGFWMAYRIREDSPVKGELTSPFHELSLPYLEKKALAGRPEIKKAAIELEGEKISKKAARLNVLPDLSLGLSKHRIEGEPSTWDVTLGFSLPLFFWQNQKGEVAEAKANIAVRTAELEQVKMVVSLAVKTAYHNALSSRNQVKYLEDDVLKEAHKVHEVSLLSYREGKIGGIDLIEAQKTLLEIKMTYSESLLNYRLALAELERCVGEEIPGGKK